MMIIRNLRFVLPFRLDLEIEPIFACAALYNMAERKKISENFYFDLNPDPLRKMIEGHVPYPDMSSVSRSCIFDITHPSPDIFLVVKVQLENLSSPYFSYFYFEPANEKGYI